MLLKNSPNGTGHESAAPWDGASFRQVLDKLPAGAYTCDAEGLITYFNERAVELWGRAPKLNDPVDRFCGSFKLFAIDGEAIRHTSAGWPRRCRTKRASTA